MVIFDLYAAIYFVVLTILGYFVIPSKEVGFEGAQLEIAKGLGFIVLYAAGLVVAVVNGTALFWLLFAALVIGWISAKILK